MPHRPSRFPLRCCPPAQMPVLVWLPRPSTGEEPTSKEIEGVVRDKEGEPVAEARLVLEFGRRKGNRASDTDQAGRFRIPEIPPGNYQLGSDGRGLRSAAQPVGGRGRLHGLSWSLEPIGASGFRTVIQSQRSALPSQDGTTTTTLTRADIQLLPGGATRQLNDVIATGQGVTPDNYGAIHVRGNFAGLQLRIDGIQLDTAIQDRLQQLLSPQIVDEARVIVGGLPAEFGEDVAGVIEVTTRRPEGNAEGAAEILYGTYDHVEGEGHVAGAVGPFNAVAAGSLETTDRGLDAPAASPILHDTLQDGRLFLSLEDAPSSRDRLELSGIYAESHYEIPDRPDAAAPVRRPARTPSRHGPVREQSSPSSSPTTPIPRSSSVSCSRGLSWRHDFGPGAQLQVAADFPVRGIGAHLRRHWTARSHRRSGLHVQQVNHQVFEGGLQADQTLVVGVNHFKAGLLFDYQRSNIAYSQFASRGEPRRRRFEA